MKMPKQAYTNEFKELAVKRIKEGQSVSIRAIHAELKGAYGSPRMVRELRARNFFGV